MEFIKCVEFKLKCAKFTQSQPNRCGGSENNPAKLLDKLVGKIGRLDAESRGNQISLD